jgi:hypothetical protein
MKRFQAISRLHQIGVMTVLHIQERLVLIVAVHITAKNE